MTLNIWIIGKYGVLSAAMQRACTLANIPHKATSTKQVDILNKDQVLTFLDGTHFTHIINCSGFTDVDGAEKAPVKAYQLNADAPKFLSQQAKIRGIKFIHFSTDYVFNGDKKSYIESDQPAPLSIYGNSKYQGEKQVLVENISALVIRTSWLFGLHGEHFVKTITKKMQETSRIFVVSDQVGQPTFAGDLAEYVLESLHLSGVRHFSNSGSVSWHDLACEIKGLLEKKIRVLCKEIVPVQSSYFSSTAKRPKSSILLSNYITPRSWISGLKEVVNESI